MKIATGVVFVLFLLLAESLVVADYTQSSWNLPFHDAQHSSLAPVKGPRSGASIKWSKTVPGKFYPTPFTVAGHVGHIFTTDSSGTVLAYNGLQKGSALWSYSMMDQQLAANGTVDMIPVILNSDEKTRQVVVSTCQFQLPHQCVLTVLNQDGSVVWSSTQAPAAPEAPKTLTGASTNGAKKDEDPRAHVSEIQWNGRILQVVPALDGDLMLVPLCGVPGMSLKADCTLFGIDPSNGRISWSQNLDAYIRGDILISRSGVAFVPQCDLSTVRPMRACKNIFAGYNVANGERIWQTEWNTTVAVKSDSSINRRSWTVANNLPDIPGFKLPSISKASSLTYELQLVSRFTGLVADNVFITLADAPNNQVFTIGIEMDTGNTRFKKLVEKATTSRLFVACAAAPSSGKPRQVFFMTGGTLFSMDTTGTMIWKNANISNWVRSMAIDQAGAIYVASSQLRSGKYVGGLDVYDARGGSYSYSISIKECVDSAAANVTIIPAFTITAERWVFMLCQSKLYAVYSAAVPIWAWVGLSAIFAIVLLAVFLIGFFYHRKYKKKFEVLE